MDTQIILRMWRRQFRRGFKKLNADFGNSDDLIIPAKETLPFLMASM